MCTLRTCRKVSADCGLLGRVGLKLVEVMVPSDFEEHLFQRRDGDPVPRDLECLQVGVEPVKQCPERPRVRERKHEDEARRTALARHERRVGHHFLHKLQRPHHRGVRCQRARFNVVRDPTFVQGGEAPVLHGRHHLVPRPELVLQKVGAALALQLPAAHDPDAVTQHVRFVHVVRGEQHCPPLLLALEQVPQLPSGQGIHARSWLVQNHELGASAERNRGGHLALHPAAELAAYVVLALVHVKVLQQLVGLKFGGGPGVGAALEQREESHVLPGRQIVEQNVVLGADAENLSGAADVLFDGVAVQGGVATRTVGRKKASQHVDRCGLAGSVVAQQAEDLAFVHVEIDAVHRGKVPKRLAHPAHLHRGRPHQRFVHRFQRVSHHGVQRGGRLRNLAKLLCRLPVEVSRVRVRGRKHALVLNLSRVRWVGGVAEAPKRGEEEEPRLLLDADFRGNNLPEIPGEHGVDGGVGEEHADHGGERDLGLDEGEEPAPAVEATHEPNLEGQGREEAPQGLLPGGVEQVGGGEDEDEEEHHVPHQQQKGEHPRGLRVVEQGSDGKR
mmetsp:Transcript_67824/g.133066  ORF Transcript_67824/g.133066 Transcript_67824/m.133066 type:complete len:559 (+) Transcript_67824:2327-4003(+)